VKVSYNGKTEFVRENRRILAHTQPRDAYDYRFHSLFQQDFYESVIMTKSKPVANSQWIDWTYMENKHDLIFDGVIAACQAKHLRDILDFKKDWNNEVIAQFYAFFSILKVKPPKWLGVALELSSVWWVLGKFMNVRFTSERKEARASEVRKVIERDPA
jgi:hypothetical protein